MVSLFLKMCFFQECSIIRLCLFWGLIRTPTELHKNKSMIGIVSLKVKIETLLSVIGFFLAFCLEFMYPTFK